MKDYEIKKLSFWKTQTVYTITTQFPGQLMKWHVLRTDEDFHLLRKLLNLQFPYMMVPPLYTPPKNKNTEKKIPKKMNLYQRFLNSIFKSEVLLTSQVLVDFLKATDRQVWDYNTQKLEKSKNFQVVSDHGKINVH